MRCYRVGSHSVTLICASIDQLTATRVTGPVLVTVLVSGCFLCRRQFISKINIGRVHPWIGLGWVTNFSHLVAWFWFILQI